ncbi:uncharacterized protein PHALS_09193 [Plasmopara halstedii]|uniref:Uncharacterized protein n=1 Tax=Plasmopara halstedii TaxID=4781 RepID=A0A0P1AEN7_PLAHL|nr:uncharacterized protein PHALS_09193 [Plasmopara halstedii]CEG39137.1 hypothetical protein PHALS_09193 [Plasmopara halstedii]|eukprot:XP_024575506.1 hypothetical protein PHALS_09193 [Plasmopara halstedii]
MVSFLHKPSLSFNKRKVTTFWQVRSRHNFKLFLQELLALEVRLSVYVTIHYVQPKNKRLQDALQSKPDRICHHYPGILHVIKAAAIGIHMFHEDQFFGLESWQ